jgi:hypothetical protein
MAPVSFDTLKMAQTLEAGGFTAQQARALVIALGEVVEAKAADASNLRNVIRSAAQTLQAGTVSGMTSQESVNLAKDILVGAIRPVR